jgi:hypothetical protein
MTSQLVFALDSPQVGRSRKRDAKTAKDAAATCDASRQRDQIMRLLSSHTEGLTADDLAARMHPVPHRSTVASRLAQLGPGLHGENVVYPFGVRVGPTGRNVQVWFLKYGARVVDVDTGGRL